jgi:hypothetical protein
MAALALVRKTPTVRISQIGGGKTLPQCQAERALAISSSFAAYNVIA